MRLRHVYTRLLNTTMVVVLQVVFHYEIIYIYIYIYEMSPPMLEQHVKESQGRGVTLTMGLASALV